jgi:hypothetical protein
LSQRDNKFDPGVIPPAAAKESLAANYARPLTGRRLDLPFPILPPAHHHRKKLSPIVLLIHPSDHLKENNAQGPADQQRNQ